MNETKYTRFLVVGAGRIGKRHIQIIKELQFVNLVGIVEPKPDNGLEAQLGVPVFSSIQNFIEAGLAADVAVIASPNGYHARQACQLLEQGLHVVIEKPMALKKTEAERVIHTALQYSRQVFVVMQNRYSPPSLWLHKMLVENRLGKIFQVQINCFWNRDERYYLPGAWHGTLALDGGVLYTQFSHFIDMMYWLFGDIQTISGSAIVFKNGELTEFEDSGLVHFDFLQGGHGSLNFSTAVWDANFESSITIIGEKGTIKVAGQYMNEVVYCHVDGYSFEPLPPSSPPNDYGAFKGSAANHALVYKNVLDVLQGRASITTNALEGLKVVEIIERIYEKIRK